MPGPLEGVKILDFTQYQNGPACTRRLCDYGATVIKIEVPNVGDPMRKMGHLKDGYDLFFEVFNRGKRSVALDLRKPEAKAVMERLVKWADVVSENFRPGTMAGWGYGYDDLRKWNPEIIVGSNSGFGPAGRLSTLGSFDMTTQAFSGAMVAQGGGPSHTPMVIDHCVADEVGALNFSFAICSAVISKLRTGKGQHFETSQLGAMCEYQGNGTSLAAAIKQGRQRDDGRPPFETNITQTYYQAADGKWLVIGIPVQKFFVSLCEVMGRKDLITDEKTKNPSARNKNQAYMKEEFGKTFKTKPRTEWLDLIWGVGVVAGPVNSYLDVRDEPHFWDNGYLAQVEHPHHPQLGKINVQGKAIRYHGTPTGPVTTGELLGESTDPVLKEMGFSDVEIKALAKSGAIQDGIGAPFSDRDSYPAPQKSKL